MAIEVLKELCAGCKVAEHCWWPASTGHNAAMGCPCHKCPIKPICQEVCERDNETIHPLFREKDKDL